MKKRITLVLLLIFGLFALAACEPENGDGLKKG